jgi:hypothetical protein
MSFCPFNQYRLTFNPVLKLLRNHFSSGSKFESPGVYRAKIPAAIKYRILEPAGVLAR